MSFGDFAIVFSFDLKMILLILILDEF